MAELRGDRMIDELVRKLVTKIAILETRALASLRGGERDKALAHAAKADGIRYCLDLIRAGIADGRSA